MDNEKDATTGIWLERNIGIQSFNLTADLQINDFFTQTSWLPRFDHFVLGQPLFGRIPVVRHAHSHAGYAKMRVADAPLDPAELFDPLAWEADVDGIRAGTRQQLEFPQQVGPVKVVPYLLGDATYWQEDLNGDDAFRAYGQAGIRASIPFWKVDPTIQNTLLNVNGLAHKISFDVDAFYADGSQDLSRFPLYDNLDDDAQEAFRRRFAFNTFGILPGGDTPLRYDERIFALRSGLQSDVTASSLKSRMISRLSDLGCAKDGKPSAVCREVNESLTGLRLMSRQPCSQRQIATILDLNFGMLDYDFRWYIGDRLSLVSDGYADFFSQGLRTVSVAYKPTVQVLARHLLDCGPSKAQSAATFSPRR